MSVRLSSIRFSAFLSLAGIGAVSGFAQIAAKSPFMPPQANNAAGPTAGAPLEFRGSMVTSEGTLYRIYDPAKKVGVWVKLNERNSDFDVLIKQHDDGQKTLAIEHQGKALTLAERESKVVSSGSAAAAVPPPIAPPVSNVSPAVTQAVVLNPTPADEQRRLDAVAAEVARRRAMREQATQQITQGGAPQVVLPQPAQNQVQPQRIPQQQPAGNYQQPSPVGTPRGRGQPPNAR
jgi:hypothetical protein